MRIHRYCLTHSHTPFAVIVRRPPLEGAEVLRIMHDRDAEIERRLRLRGPAVDWFTGLSAFPLINFPKLRDKGRRVAALAARKDSKHGCTVPSHTRTLASGSPMPQQVSILYRQSFYY